MTIVEFQKELAKAGCVVTKVNMKTQMGSPGSIEFSYTKSGKSLVKEVAEKELGPELAKTF